MGGLVIRRHTCWGMREKQQLYGIGIVLVGRVLITS